MNGVELTESPAFTGSDIYPRNQTVLPLAASTSLIRFAFSTAFFSERCI